MEPIIFSLTESKELTHEICEKLKIKETEVIVKNFKDGEGIVEILDSVRNREVFVIQSTINPAAEKLMELLMALDALKRASAKRITAVIPYFGYARQDRIAHLHQPITAKLVASMIERAGADHVMTIEIHSAQSIGFFDIPSDNFTVIGLLADYFVKNKINKDIVIVAPDHGGIKRARDLSRILNAPLAIIDKRREVANEVAEMNLIGDVKNKIAIIIDDLIDTGGTIIKASDVLIKNGATKVYVAVAHTVLSGDAAINLQNSSIEKVISTNSINLPKEKRFEKLEIISLKDMLADIIKCQFNNTNITKVIKKYSGNIIENK